jgi:hypothetical protein
MLAEGLCCHHTSCPTQQKQSSENGKKVSAQLPKEVGFT